MIGYKIKAKSNSNTELLLFGNIGDDFWAEESNDAKTVVSAINEVKTPNLALRINSFGGIVADGLAIYNALDRHPAHVTTHIDGVAYSIASLIAMAGNRIEMAKNATLMIHGPHGGAYGNARDMEDMADVLDKVARAMISSYIRDGGPDEATVRGWLEDGEDHFFTADEALELGLIDGISAAQPVADIAARMRELSPRYIVPLRIAAIYRQPETEMSEEQKTQPEEMKTGNADLRLVARGEKRGRKEGEKVERKRQLDIRELFDQYEYFHGGVFDDLKYVAIDRGYSVERTRQELLELVGNYGMPFEPDIQPQQESSAFTARQAPTSQPGRSPSTGLRETRVQPILDGVDKLRDGIVAALVVRAGLETDKEKVRESRASGMVGRSLIRMAEEYLRATGVDTRNLDDKSISKYALRAAGPHSHDDFTDILANVATKSALRGWTEANTTWETWCNTGELPDFKQATISALGAFPDLDRIPSAGGPYHHASMADVGETAQLGTYGKLFGISRAAIISDDMGEFTRVPRAMGSAAARKVNTIAYNVLTQASYVGQTMTEDSVALFNAAHNNYVASGSGGAPAVATLNIALAAMRKQKAPLPTGDSSNPYLNIEPAFLLTVPDLEGTSRQLIESTYDPTTGSNRRDAVNIWKDRLELVVDPNLTLTTGWWLAAPKMGMIDTVTVFFLNGIMEPYIEQMEQGTSDGTTFKVRIDAVARALDFRGLYFNYGA